MKPSNLVIAGILLTGGVAVAQPDPDQPADPEGATAPADEVEPPPARPIAAFVREPEPVAEPEPTRPTGFSVGLGLGYSMPADLSMPDVTSVRFRLASGLTFEPTLALVQRNTSDDAGGDAVDDDIVVAALVRYPLRSQGRVDFNVLGGVAVALLTRNPDGGDNTQTVTGFGLEYGLGLDYWFSRHWDLSMSASNALVQRVSSTQETGPGTDSSFSRTTFGLVFDPRLLVTLHLHL